MPQNDTAIIRAALERDASIHRDIEIEDAKSLYKLAEAIVSSFGFDFDHAFGFYTGLTRRDDDCRSVPDTNFSPIWARRIQACLA